MDTGSDLLLIDCSPDNPINKFNPKKLSSFQDISCHNPICDRSSKYLSCDSSNQCSYRKSFGSGKYTYGIYAYPYGTYAYETFSFGTKDDGITSVTEVIFGCSSNFGDNAFANKESDGTLGLGKWNLCSSCLVAFFRQGNGTTKPSGQGRKDPCVKQGKGSEDRD
ncbi:aspartic proteinase CDR1-like [Senna tora]|uniref:Aspartic proteinase CDR1-like n=1 Tax=Senna tora TaxID=362788 RepID=A0A834XGA5_9FABA|nr:aspartic proteinase CDR1-like [Senna tora]